jgi:hypothetical protein
MFSSILPVIAVLASLLAVSDAHTVLTYPGWRGDNLVTNDTFPYGMQWMYPCEYFLLGLERRGRHRRESARCRCIGNGTRPEERQLRSSALQGTLDELSLAVVYGKAALQLLLPPPTSLPSPLLQYSAQNLY